MINFLIKLLKALLPEIIKELLKIKPTYTKSDGKGKTEEAMKEKIRRKWGKK